MRDRIGNKLAVGDKVLVGLPENQIFGFVAQVEEPGLIAVRGKDMGTERTPGRILVSCVVALPLDDEHNMVFQVTKVHDVAKDEQSTVPEIPN